MSVHPQTIQQVEHEDQNPADPKNKKISGNSETSVFMRGLKYVFHDFATWSSTHGLPHIALANVTWLRLFWVLVVLAALGGCIWQLIVLILKYLAFNVNTDTELQYSDRIFPAVTICNLNPWKLQSTKASSAEMASLIQSFDDQQADTTYGFDAGLSIDRQQRADDWTLLFSERLGIINNGTPISYTYDDLVVSCTFNAKTCNSTDFSTYLDATYGQCIQFNFASQYKSSRAGPLYGLRMVLKTDQALYLPWTDAAGVIIVIQSQDQDPFPDVSGYFAAPGTASSMGVRYTRTESQPAPYGNCTTRTNLTSTHYNGTYCVEACYRTCLQSAIIEECRCYDPSLAHADGVATSCDNGTDSLQGLNCMTTYAAGFNVIEACDCPIPCDTEEYTVTVSTAQWPAKNYKPTDCTLDSGKGNASDPWYSNPLYPITTYPNPCVAWYQANTLLVEIYYEMMNFQVLTESPAYTLVNLIADLGGQIGLFLGMSIISGLEILFLCILLCCYCCTHKKRKEDFQKFEDDLKKAKDEADEIEMKAKKEEEDMYHNNGDPLPPAVMET